LASDANRIVLRSNGVPKESADLPEALADLS
jgi:hypothetical protein